MAFVGPCADNTNTRAIPLTLTLPNSQLVTAARRLKSRYGFLLHSARWQEVRCRVVHGFRFSYQCFSHVKGFFRPYVYGGCFMPGWDETGRWTQRLRLHSRLGIEAAVSAAANSQQLIGSLLRSLSARLCMPGVRVLALC